MNKLFVLLLIILVIILFTNKTSEGFSEGYGYKPNPNYSIYTYPAGYMNYLPEKSIGVPSSGCEKYGDDYNSCYADPQCTIWFKSDGSTYCRTKFIHEDI